jgi:hypothetical protein
MVDYSSADFRRLTPAEHRRIGVIKSRRLYVLKDVAHVTELTPTISMNKYYNLKTREETGLASRHAATEARKHGALGYKSAQSEETAGKISERAVEKRVRKQIAADAAAGARVRETNSDGSFKTGRRASMRGYRLTAAASDRYFDLRARKLDGEYIDNGEWHWLMDMARRYGDPKVAALYAYPPSYGVRNPA